VTYPPPEVRQLTRTARVRVLHGAAQVSKNGKQSVGKQAASRGVTPEEEDQGGAPTGVSTRNLKHL
jgi:hypothetical protein